ncbi:DUF3846 domain-containing protein [Streptomyces klenkii]|nr:DUF3846 domain-containing protein [Streptomyces klenkii]
MTNRILGAVVIPADANRLITLDAIPAPSASAEWLRGKVGGPLELLRLSGERDMWLHGEGKIANLPVNMGATGLALLNGIADVIHGDVVLTGHDGPETVGMTGLQIQRTHAELTLPFRVLFL